MRMDTVNNNQITILGAVILNIAVQSQGGTRRKRKQIVTDELDKFYLSRQACTDLCMILPTFPTISETTHHIQLHQENLIG